MSTEVETQTQRASLAIVADMSPADRLARAAAMNRAAETLALAGLRRRHPTATAHALGVALALQRLGRQGDHVLAERLSKETTVSDSPADFLIVAVRAASICTALGIDYLIGGGVASTVHGEFRTTRDVDLVVRLKRVDAGRFAAALAADFTLNPPDILDALARLPIVAADRTQRATFAAFDRATGYQLDVFCASDSPFDRSQFERAIPIPVPQLDVELIVASAEDTVLTKLEWYKITPSDQQWGDVQTILRVQAGALDLAYLDTWAARLGIADLWAAARQGDRAPHHAALRDDSQQLRMDL
jgi:hypothetical protein